MEKDHPPQYLIALSPPLLLSNYNFQAMELRDRNNHTLDQIAPKETSVLHSVDCINAKPELLWCTYDPSIKNFLQLHTPGFDISKRLNSNIPELFLYANANRSLVCKQYLTLEAKKYLN